MPAKIKQRIIFGDCRDRMDDLTKFRREMSGLQREFGRVRREFRKLQAEFKERARTIRTSWEQADRLMQVHMRDMEEFRTSQRNRLARQADRRRDGRGEDAEKTLVLVGSFLKAE